MKPLYGQSLRGWLLGLGIALVAATTFSFCVSIFQVYVIDAIAHSRTLPEGADDLSDTLTEWSAIVQLAVYIPFFILFVIWLRASYRNVELLGQRIDYKPGWAIGSFFVPILGLFRPYQIMKEVLEKSSAPAPGPQPERTFLLTGWVLFLCSATLGQIALRTTPKTGSPIGDFTGYSWIMLVSDFLDIVVNPLFLAFVVLITDKQTRRWEELQAGVPAVTGQDPLS